MRRPNLFYLARQNVRRRMFRTTITILCVAVMIATLIATQLFTQGVGHGLQIGMERLGADLIVIPVGTEQSAQTYLLTGHAEDFYMNDSVLQAVRGLPEIEKASPQIFLTTLQSASCCATGNLQIVGIDPLTDFTVTPWLAKPLANDLSSDDGIIGSQVYTTFGAIQPQFFGRNYTIVGKLQPTQLGLDNSFFITIGAARSIIQANNQGLLPHKLPITIAANQISDVVVKLKPSMSISLASDDIKSSIPNVDVITASDMTVTVQNELSGLLQSVYIFGGAVWAVAVIMIGAIFSMSVNERRREIGLLRAIGSTSRFIFGLITVEGTLLTIVGGIVGIIAGGFIIYVFNGFVSKVLQLNFIWPTTTQIGLLAVEGVAIATIIGVLASAYPAYTSSKMEPYAAIREE